MDQVKEISSLLAGIKESESIERFFHSLLTEKEILDVSLRWELVKLLDQGMSQRKIAKKLGVSLCKITRGSRELKRENSIFKVFIDFLKLKNSSTGKIE